MKTISIKILSILFALTFVLTAVGFSAYADEEETSESTTAETVAESTTASEPMTIKEESAEEETTQSKEAQKNKAKKSLKEQRADLQKNIEKNQKLLEKYEGSAKATQEYIDALDEKIGYLNEELNLLDAEVAEAEKKVQELDEQIEPLEKELEKLRKTYEKSKKKYDKLSKSFVATYNAYCLRLKAMYISGQSSVLGALLSSKDLSQFLNRFEMIRSVAKSDTALLRDVNEKMEKLLDEQTGLEAQKAQAEQAQSVLNAKKLELKKEQDSITEKQKEIAEKKIAIADDRAESDRLFAQYSENAKLYTEFRNEDEELLKKVDKEINDLLSGLKDPAEVTTASVSEHSKSASDSTSTEGELFSRSNGALNLSYPVPSHHGVSQAFGHYRNGRAHTGIDYPCPTGSKVVAAQKGIVIKVERLNYSYGYYVMIYHGTDAQGRKVVTLYAHNSSLLVSVGQSVRKGQQIAKSGSTGNSTGPHCHFELILGGSKVNPKNYLG